MESALRQLEDDRFVHKTISNDQFKRISERYQSDIRDLERKLEINQKDYSDKVDELRKILALAENVGDAFSKADISEKRMYLQVFIKKAWVKNKRLCHIELNDNIKQLIEGGRVCVNKTWGD